MPAILTQMVYLRYRAGAPAVAPVFAPRYRVQVNTQTTHRLRADSETTHRVRVNTQTTHRVRVDV